MYVYLGFDDKNNPHFTVSGPRGVMKCEANKEELVETIKKLHNPDEKYHTEFKRAPGESESRIIYDWLKQKKDKIILRNYSELVR